MGWENRVGAAIFDEVMVQSEVAGGGVADGRITTGDVESKAEWCISVWSKKTHTKHLCTGRPSQSVGPPGSQSRGFFLPSLQVIG